MKRVFSVLGSILIVLFLVISLTVMVLVLTSQRNGGLPNLMGYSPLAVLSDSMDAEPANIKKGDMIIVQQAPDYNKLEVDQVVTYFSFLNGLKYFDTHRIVEIEPHNNTNYYVTKGDNSPEKDIERASFENIVGVWTGIKIPYLGTVMELLKTQIGIFFCIVLPLALLFIWQLYKFIMLMAENKREKAIEAVTSTLEEEKQKAIDEYIAQQKAQEDAAKLAETAAATAAADLEREKQKAVEEYIAQQKAAEEAQRAEDAPNPNSGQEQAPAAEINSTDTDEEKTQENPTTAENEPAETIGDGSSVPEEEIVVAAVVAGEMIENAKAAEKITSEEPVNIEDEADPADECGIADQDTDEETDEDADEDIDEDTNEDADEDTDENTDEDTNEDTDEDIDEETDEDIDEDADEDTNEDLDEDADEDDDDELAGDEEELGDEDDFNDYEDKPEDEDDH